MKVSLVNPAWSYEGSVYFGCREPHLPLELGYAAELLRERGHDCQLLDAHMTQQALPEIREEIRRYEPDFTVVTTAPTYLFWRCAPPELRVPIQLVGALRDYAGELVVVGPHASTTPRATLKKLNVRFAIQGECEEAIAELADTDLEGWATIPGVVSCAEGDEIRVNGGPRAVQVQNLPALKWPLTFVRRHSHHHHRFDRPPTGSGAEVEASRGCPYACTFCAKENFRNKFRQRPLRTVLQEVDALIESGVTYIYFVDEIFLPNRELLEALAERPIQFGVQMRIDLFDEETLSLLGRAGCVSIEAGVESITSEGRSLLAKRCKKSTAELIQLLVHAKRSVPFVQANLLNSTADSPADVQLFRQTLIAQGVWVNDPVPLFPYPGSPDYTQRWGKPDDTAWERALEHYLVEFDRFSDIQDRRPRPLVELEGRVDA
jgi:B12-binding domain/radical SAM domain protein of rhizo-twelve system